ncbi:MAG TPA: MarR family transcriptional regulator [Solirubrobacteraceae bacterium]|nr:MarR family transcriptional regulator [Solirubrobacteraceae bacterium]
MQGPGVTTDVDRLTDDLFDFLALAAKEDEGEIFDVARELDLTLSQLCALFVIQNADHPMTLTELAPRVRLSVAATGRLLDGLERLGLVTRSEDPTDRRVKRLTLTPQADTLTERFNAARRESLRAFTKTLTDEQRDLIGRALASVLEEHR